MHTTVNLRNPIESKKGLPRTYCLERRTENDLFSSNIHSTYILLGTYTETGVSHILLGYLHYSFILALEDERPEAERRLPPPPCVPCRTLYSYAAAAAAPLTEKKESNKSLARATFSRQQSYDTLRASIVAIKGHPTLLHSTENWAFMAAFLVIENFWHFLHSWDGHSG